MRKSIWTWLLAACPWTLWGFIFKSIIFVSVSAWPSSLASWTGDSRWWFCWLSSTVTLCGGGWLCTLPISLGTLECGDGSSRFIGLSPGNWKRTRTSKLQSKCRWKIHQGHIAIYQPTSTLCRSKRYLLCVLFPPTWTIMSHCKQRELPSISQ